MLSRPAPSSVPCPSCGESIPEAEQDCPRCGRALFSLTKGAVISGRYEILGLLGKGGMGAVYEAHDRELDERVAIKVLRPEGADGDSEQRFRAELKLARRVQHQNICKVFDFGRHGTLLFIVMERIEGTSLGELIKSGKAIGDPLALIDGIAQGLGAIHAVGVVHRDLKPANISVSGGGAVKVMDFGVAKEVGTANGLTATGMLIGTPFYMSPEQARGDHVDHRTDVYALGVIVCELLGGFRPFVGDTPVQVIVGHLNKRPDLSRLPPQAIPVVARALSKAPEDRYDSAAEMAQDLRRALSGQRVASVTHPIPDRSRELALVPTITSLAKTARAPRRLKTSRALLALAAIALLFAMGMLVLQPWKPPDSVAQTVQAPPVAALTAVAAVEGSLLIDARPWARVIAILGPRGAPVTLPTDAFTPLRLSVPTQDYDVVLVGPDGQRQQRLPISVVSGQEAKVIAQFGAATSDSVERLLQGMNWK